MCESIDTMVRERSACALVRGIKVSRLIVSVGVPAQTHRDKHIPYAGRAKLTRAQAHYRFSDTDGSLQAGPRRHHQWRLTPAAN